MIVDVPGVEVLEELRKGDEHLPVPLTDSEYAERAERAARLSAQADELDVERKEQAAALKTRAAELRAEVAFALREIRERARQAHVLVFEVLFDDGLVRRIREDTGEVLSERAATPEERQGRLFQLAQSEQREETGTDDAEAGDEP